MPIDRGILDKQLQALGESPRWWDERELRDLPNVMQGDEQLVALVRGKIARVRWLHRSWLIVVTDRRLVCLRSAGSPKWTQLEVAGSLITRVTLRIGPFRGRVIVVAGGHTYRLLAPRADAYRLFNALSTFVPAPKPATLGYRPALMVRRVIDHVLSLPAVALRPDTPAAQPVASGPAVDEQVELLEGQLAELRKQVDFLEQLLHQHHGEREPTRQLQSE